MSKPTSKRDLLRQQQSHKRSIPFLLSWVGGVVLLGALLFVFITNASTTPKAESEIKGAPRLRVDKETVELGDRKLGSDVEVVLEVTNIGDQLLRFTDKPYVQVVEGC